MTQKFVPNHLKQYIVNQDYSKYTYVDHSVWRYIMKINIDFFIRHGHESYIEGLRGTGISLERIPRIEDMDEKLSKIAQSCGIQSKTENSIESALKNISKEDNNAIIFLTGSLYFAGEILNLN